MTDSMDQKRGREYAFQASWVSEPMWCLLLSFSHFINLFSCCFVL